MRHIIGKLSYEMNGINHIEHDSFRILEPGEVAVNRETIIKALSGLAPLPSKWNEAKASIEALMNAGE